MTLALPLLTAWAQGVILVLLLALAILAATTRARRERDRAEADADRQRTALSAQPLLDGETRWLVEPNALDWAASRVVDSLTNERDTGIATGWAVGHPISEWAPPGTLEAEHWRAAIVDKHNSTFRTRWTDAAGKPRAGRVALMVRSDGLVYGEAWDMTEETRALEAATERAETAERNVARLMRFATEDAQRLFAQSPPSP